jgi:rod shape determining protein RodA
VDGRGAGGASQTNLDFLPEHATDFIFASLAEQRGFLGAAILLLLYALIVWRGIRIVAVADSLFSAIVAGAIVAGLLFQVFLNVGMTIGVAPITGIPLPFVSYGGSSMITSLAMIGILQAIRVRGRLGGAR